MSKIIKLFTVYSKGIAYLTCHGLDEDVANKLGFEIYEPENGRFQFYLEKPAKKHLPKFLNALAKNDIKVKVVDYSDEMSEELEWEIWDGYRWGFKDATEPQKEVSKQIEVEKEFEHLAAASIKCVFKKGKPIEEPNGKYTFAYVTLGSKAAKRLRKYDFVIVFYEKIWEYLNDEQKKRLVFHELLHCGFKGSPFLIGHDIECFRAEHKKWNVPYGKNVIDEGLYDLVKDIYGDEDK